jgi:hypothetical protein
VDGIDGVGDGNNGGLGDGDGPDDVGGGFGVAVVLSPPTREQSPHGLTSHPCISNPTNIRIVVTSR